MGRPEEVSALPQPDGGLLSLLGDLLFAGAILLIIYPCLRRTVERLDRQFFRQLLHILEVMVAVAGLGFVLMLLVAQQMRMTYCSFIRPYVGDSSEDKIYAGVLLKILVCALLVFNYFCASGLQRIVGSVSDGFGVSEIQQALGTGLAGSGSRLLRMVTMQEVLANNSNTNSQTPVTQTQTVTHSDILSSLSCPAIYSDSFLDQLPISERRPQLRLYRDVGTMVRFPEYPSSVCSVRVCKSQVSCPPSDPGHVHTTTTTTTPCPPPSRSNPLHCPVSGSRGFCVQSDLQAQYPPGLAVPSRGHPRAHTSYSVGLRGGLLSAAPRDRWKGQEGATASRSSSGEQRSGPKAGSQAGHLPGSGGGRPGTTCPVVSLVRSTTSSDGGCPYDQTDLLSAAIGSMAVTQSDHYQVSEGNSNTLGSCQDAGFLGAFRGGTSTSGSRQASGSLESSSAAGRGFQQTDLRSTALTEKSRCPESRYQTDVSSVASSSRTAGRISGCSCTCSIKTVSAHSSDQVSQRSGSSAVHTRRRPRLPAMLKMTRSGKIYGYG